MLYACRWEGMGIGLCGSASDAERALSDDQHTRENNVTFVNPKEMLEKARAGGYAVPAFNSNGGTYDIARAAVEAAEEMGAPLILQTYQNNLAYRGYGHAARLSALVAEGAAIPIALQLDHGHDVAACEEALSAGYTSVMIDGSALPLSENIAVTRQTLELAAKSGAAVEGEIGHIVIQKGEDKVAAAPKTDVDEAREFVKETGVDILAVAIGTTHGVLESQTNIDLDLLRTLCDSVDAPLVLHGTCGIPHALLTKCVENGIAKANFGEVFREPYLKYFGEFLQTMDHQDHPWRVMQACKDRLREDMKALIRALGAEGKGR